MSNTPTPTELPEDIKKEIDLESKDYANKRYKYRLYPNEWMAAYNAHHAGATAMYEKLKAASQPIGAVWVKGEYDRLYDQVKGGKRTVCFVDYRYGHVDQEQVCRDICTIDNEGWEFFARGIGYGRLSYAMKKYGMAQDSAFVKICEEMNVEWLDESPTAAGETEESIFDQYHAIKEKIGNLGYNTFINSIEVEQYREWLRNDRYKHRIEWFEKEYPNGLYSKDSDGDLFGINIMTKKFLAEADAAYEQPPAAGDGKEEKAFALWLAENTQTVWENKIPLYRYCDNHNEWGNYILDDIYTEYKNL
jgi:hypothetical protein